MPNFEELRNTFLWLTYGRDMHGEPREILLKDISDSHLLHIIGYISNMMNMDSRRWSRTWMIMHEEAKYRFEHMIFVEDYK